MVDTDDDHIEGLAASARRMAGAVRVRIGVGAGVVLLIAALAVAVAISAFTPHGATRTVTTLTAATGPPGTAAADGAATGATGATDAGGRVSGAAQGRATQAAAAPAPLFVHVLGAVRNPGLFQVHAGARVVDAVAAAGGFADDANQGGVNLARVIADGEQIVVPRVGEDLPPPPAATSGGAAGTAAGAGAATTTTPVNINTATTAELETLPRIGPAMAQRIVDWRTTNGRFTSIDDLLSVTGIGQKTLDGFKDLVRL